MLITGTVDTRSDDARIRASSAEPLSEVRARNTGEVWITLDVQALDADRLAQLKEVLGSHRGGCRTRLRLGHADWIAEVGVDKFPTEPSTTMEELVNAMFAQPVVELR